MQRSERRESRSNNDREQEKKREAFKGEYPKGSIILSRDKRTRYRVQEDGSWRRMSPQEEGEFEQVKKFRGEGDGAA